MKFLIRGTCIHRRDSGKEAAFKVGLKIYQKVLERETKKQHRKKTGGGGSLLAPASDRSGKAVFSGDFEGRSKRLEHRLLSGSGRNRRETQAVGKGGKREGREKTVGGSVGHAEGSRKEDQKLSSHMSQEEL